MAAVTYSNKDENRFWLQVLGDNALLVYNAITPKEAEDVPRAKALADRFDALLLRANQNPTAEQTAQLNKEAFQVAQDFRKFILGVLDKLLTRTYHIDLKPATLNLFVSEAEKYLDLLNALMQNRKPAFEPLLEEIFWLPIFSLQNRYIADNIGYFQEQNRERAQRLATYLNNYAAYSVVLKGLSRIGTDDFPMVQEHHIVTVDLLNRYYDFLNNITVLQQQKKVPGSMSLLYLDRSRRMLCYFLKHMSVFLDSKAPDCDPYAKRISTR